MENNNEKSNDLPWFVPVGIILLILWGLFGLLEGDGFFGGIGKQIDSIGDIISWAIKGGLFLGAFWLFFELLKRRDERKEKKKNGTNP